MAGTIEVDLFYWYFFWSANLCKRQAFASSRVSGNQPRSEDIIFFPVKIKTITGSKNLKNSIDTSSIPIDFWSFFFQETYRFKTSVIVLEWTRKISSLVSTFLLPFRPSASMDLNSICKYNFFSFKKAKMTVWRLYCHFQHSDLFLGFLYLLFHKMLAKFFYNLFTHFERVIQKRLFWLHQFSNFFWLTLRRLYPLISLGISPKHINFCLSLLIAFLKNIMGAKWFIIFLFAWFYRAAMFSTSLYGFEKKFNFPVRSLWRLGILSWIESFSKETSSAFSKHMKRKTFYIVSVSSFFLHQNGIFKKITQCLVKWRSTIPPWGYSKKWFWYMWLTRVAESIVTRVAVASSFITPLYCCELG